MTRSTVPMQAKHSFKETMRQGIQAMSGKDLPTYTLLFLDPARGKMKGEHMNVVVPYLELGRSSRCAIRFGEEYPTVSRIHASLQQSGGQTVLKHLGTNPTLVNGQPVQDNAVLRNGDEIQLSYEGPRIRFNVAATGTASMKFTQRMALYTRQALAPYKKAVAAMALLLILAVTGLGYLNSLQSDRIREQSAEIDVLSEQLIDTETKIKELEDKAKKQGMSSADRKLLKELRKQQGQIKSSISDISVSSELKEGSDAISSPRQGNESLSAAEYFRQNQKDIYYIAVQEVVVTIPGKKPVIVETGWSGTGFITTDERFFTARHVVTPWRYNSIYRDPILRKINQTEQEGGRVDVKFKAWSPGGDVLEFTSSELTFSTYKDELIPLEEEDDEKGKKRKKKSILVKMDVSPGETDWAYMKVPGRKGSFNLNPELSKSLLAGEKIFISGYQHFGLTYDKRKGLSPNYSEANVAQDNLVNHAIQTTNSGVGPGTSGAPAIVFRDGEFHLVGILTKSFGANSTQGIVTPACNIR